MSSAGGLRDRLGTRTRLDLAAVGLGALALAVAATSAIGGELDFRVRGWGLVVTLVLGVLAIASGWLGRRLLAPIAGAGFLAAAVVQLVQLGGEAGAVEHGVLGGNASTFAVWVGLGVGLAIVGAQSR